jgi:hypothetical protein
MATNEASAMSDESGWRINMLPWRASQCCRERKSGDSNRADRGVPLMTTSNGFHVSRD